MADEKNILDEEHEELIEMLGEVARKKTETGRLFSEVLRIFRYHLDKENETVGPLLAYLRERLGEYMTKDKESLNHARTMFEDSYPAMMREHEEMAKLFKILGNVPTKRTDDEKRELFSDLLELLTEHNSYEESFIYDNFQDTDVDFLKSVIGPQKGWKCLFEDI